MFVPVAGKDKNSVPVNQKLVIGHLNPAVFLKGMGRKHNRSVPLGHIQGSFLVFVYVEIIPVIKHDVQFISRHQLFNDVIDKTDSFVYVKRVKLALVMPVYSVDNVAKYPFAVGSTLLLVLEGIKPRCVE